MNPPPPTPPSFGRTVWILLRATRKRSEGRRTRQQQLLNQRSNGKATDWGVIGFLFAILFMAVIHVLAAFVVHQAVSSSAPAQARFDAISQGKIVVSQSFYTATWNNSNSAHKLLPQAARDQMAASYESRFASEARSISRKYGGSQPAIESQLREAVRLHGTDGLVPENNLPRGFTFWLTHGRYPALLGSLTFLLWCFMLIFQGEGLELDLQRRRHPMWEWLFSHPIPPGAVFLTEMLSPIAANPIFWSAPLFVGILYYFPYSLTQAALAAPLIGIPITLAAACLGKACEIAILLRLSPRSRGAVIGIMGWVSYVSMMAFLFGVTVITQVANVLYKFLHPLTFLPWPWLRLFLGGRPDGSFSFLTGMLTCWAFAGITLAIAVWFCVWGTQQGLSGNFAADSRPSRASGKAARFGREPLYRKEYLWFIRDRSAIVQTILVPLTVAGFQAFNLRGVVAHAQGAWNYLCGVGIVFGTYFLWILGPKSLASEGSALWIALTWPRGLESLLKAKAWLWSLISTGIVSLVLLYAAFQYPAESWKILLVGIGWAFFGRSMAEKSVTLVSITSESGEVQKIPWGRRGAAQLGMLTFSIGVVTQQWHLAILGIVYSFITAAAMWENFRARLPFLYDPWSEKLPPPPTLMNAMISISILVEGGAIVTGILAAFMGAANIAVAQAMGYAICAVVVSIGASNYLGNRDVLARNIWYWRTSPADDTTPQPLWRGYGPKDGKLIPALLAGIGGGLLLGFFAHGYMAVLSHLPATAELIRRSQEQMAKVHYLHASYFVMAVFFAPFAEEYLFRGLLYRSLDREWGGWRAIAGSAAFFAIYHPPLAWLPVAMLGATNAILFKKTGRLAPAVLLHMVYNAVVLS